ncbi:hypothetical protein ACQZ46_23835 [Agrobacterium salinitolerans]
MIRWEIERRDAYESTYRAWLGSTLVTEFEVDEDWQGVPRPGSWYYYRLICNDDQHYNDHWASTVEEAIAQIEAYVAAWMSDAGVVKAGVA